jgi:hypothetical protein
MMLNYDLTFLAMLLTGLYEPETRQEKHRCLPHPLQKHPMTANEAMDYAADMCVLLAWQKFSDDWTDEKSLMGKAGAAALHRAYLQIAEKYPRQAGTLDESVRQLHCLEQQGVRDIDAVAGLTGQFLAEIFVWKEDIWQEDLRTMGFYMGKYIYLIDAVEDLDKDRKHGSYNLFADYGPIWGNEREQEIREMLMDMMSEASRAFERLPILTNVEIMRNILYSGVWCKYASIRSAALDKEKKE